VPEAERRAFSTAHKLRVVEEADDLSQPGQIGARLRRDGLYSATRCDTPIDSTR